MSTKLLFVIMTVLAFASIICFFNINSAFADEHKANTPILIAGIVLGIAAAFTLYKISSKSGSSPND